MSRKKTDRRSERIAEGRLEVERRLGALRSAIADETGHAPTGRGILTGLLAGAVGVALAQRGRTRKERGLSGGEPVLD